MEIFKIFGSVFLKDEEAQKSLTSIDKKADGVGTKIGNMAKSALKLGAGMAAATGAAGVGLFKIASSTSDAASEINDMSVRTGLSTDRLQELKYATGQVGVDFDTVTGAVGKLTKSMAGADEGSKGAQEAFGKLGVNVTNADGSLRSMDTIFPEVLTKLSNMTNETDRNALAMDLFGKGAMELGPLLSTGGEGIKGLSDEAHSLGLVLSQDAITANDNFGDSLDKVKSSLSAVVANVGTELLPIFQKMFDWILLNMPTIQTTFDTVFTFISDVVKIAIDIFNLYLLPILKDLYKWIEDNMPTIQTVFDTVFTFINDILKEAYKIFNESILPILKDLFKWIMDNMPTIQKTMDTVFTAITKDILPALGKAFKVLVENVLPPVKKIIKDLVEIVLPPLKKAFEFFYTDILPILGRMFEEIMPKLSTAVSKMWEIMEPILTALSKGFTIAFDIIKPLVVGTFEAISTGVSTAMSVLNGILSFITDIFQGKWKAAWDDVKSVFTSIWDGIKDGAKSVINGIIGAMNGMINGLNKININVPDWVPGVGGKSLGFNLSKIPMLAKGGNIMDSGSVIVGENGPELLSNMKGATVTPLGKSGVVININNPKFFNDKDVDILGNSLVSRLRTLGVR